MTLLSTVAMLVSADAEACSGPMATVTVSTVEDTMISQGDPTGLWASYWVNLSSIETGINGLGEAWSLYELDGTAFSSVLDDLASGGCLDGATFEVDMVDMGYMGPAETNLSWTDPFDPFSVYWNIQPAVNGTSDTVLPVSLGTVAFDATDVVIAALEKYEGEPVRGPYLALTPNGSGYNWWGDLTGEMTIHYQTP